MKINLNKFNLNGWVPDEPDSRDYQWSNYFGATALPSEVLPESFSWIEKCPPLPTQDKINSCVCNSFAFLQAFNSKKERNFDDLLSWSFIWANIPKTEVGSTFRDNAKCVQDLGICEEILYSKEIGIKDNFNKEKIEPVAIENAKVYKIKNYSYVNLVDLKRAIIRQPVIIAVPGRNLEWSNPSSPIKFCGWDRVEWNHAIVLIGWDKDGNWIVANWWGKNWYNKGYGLIKSDYPLLSMLAVEDIPDNNLNVMKFIKRKDNPSVYLINDNIAYPINSSTDYFALEKDWGGVQELSDEEFSKYTISEKKLYVFLR
jgi:hypothetical protein